MNVIDFVSGLDMEPVQNQETFGRAQWHGQRPCHNKGSETVTQYDNGIRAATRGRATTCYNMRPCYKKITGGKGEVVERHAQRALLDRPHLFGMYRKILVLLEDVFSHLATCHFSVGGPLRQDYRVWKAVLRVTPYFLLTTFFTHHFSYSPLPF
jgi:hypothetical protein